MGSEGLAWCVEGPGVSIVLEVVGGLRGRKLTGSAYTLSTPRCGFDPDLSVPSILGCSENVTQGTGAEALVDVTLSRAFTHSDALIQSAG